jgi:hypothetical protein
MSTAKRLLVIVAAVCLIAVVPGCHQETEQDKVKKIITGIQKAAEDKDIKKIVASLSKTYTDQQGYDHDTIKGLLMGYFFRHQRVHVYIPDIVILVEGVSANVELQAVLTGNQAGSAAGILPESLGIYAFAVSLHKEDDEWKVISAHWNRVGEGKE